MWRLRISNCHIKPILNPIQIKLMLFHVFNAASNMNIARGQRSRSELIGIKRKGLQVDHELELSCTALI